jgi:hypothetical protein
MLRQILVKKILLLFRMRAAAVAGHTGNGRGAISLFVLFKVKILFIDLRCHLEHLAGDVLFGLCIAGEIEVMGGAVGGGSVAKITFHAQRGLPVVHDLVQVLITDVLWEDLQVFELFLCLGFFCGHRTGGGHTKDHKSHERQGNSEFFTVQDHNGRFRVQFKELTVQILIFFTIF